MKWKNINKKKRGMPKLPDWKNSDDGSESDQSLMGLNIDSWVHLRDIIAGFSPNQEEKNQSMYTCY